MNAIGRRISLAASDRAALPGGFDQAFAELAHGDFLDFGFIARTRSRTLFR
jgi:hypothetical protein